MSLSPKSKPESPSSRATGDAAADGGGADGTRGASPAPSAGTRKSSTVELEVQRHSALGWTLFQLVLGTLLITKLGTVGVWAGIALLAHAAYRAARLIQSYVYAPGTFRINEREVTLPRGLSMPRPLVVAPAEVTAVYFLRRAVPWNKSSPVLVVEVGDKAIAYPRDWFSSEADQRQIVHALIQAKQPVASP